MIVQSIKYLRPGIGDDDFDVQNDGAGPVIKRWTHASAVPTQAEIDAVAPTVLAAIAAAQAEADAYEADRADLKAQYAAAATRLAQIRDDPLNTNALMIAAVRDLAAIQLRMLKYIRGL